MDEQRLRALLAAVAEGALPIEDAVSELRRLPFEAVGNFATLDTHRGLRQGFPEVVFCAGKTPAQSAAIIERLAARGPRLLATRATEAHFAAARALVPDLHFHPDAGVIWLKRDEAPPRPGLLVLAAGTSDLAVAEEAALTAEVMGHEVARHYDVGVAGLHRLLARLPALQSANVIVVVAGMEGALPSVVAGLVRCPVIAVPTSVGYGASFNGLAALLTMLNSCASGIGVVNIDNGFGGGYLAAMINAQAGELWAERKDVRDDC